MGGAAPGPAPDRPAARKLVEERLVRRQRTGIGAAFLVLVAVLAVWYVLETQQLHDAQSQADQEQATATSLRAQRAKLQPLAELEAQIAAAERLRASVYRNEIRFSSVMRDISAIVPGDVWLTSMAVAFNDTANAAQTGTATPAPSTTGAGAAATTPGSPGAGSPVARSPSPVPGSSTSTSAGSCGRWPAGPRRADSRCT